MHFSTQHIDEVMEDHYDPIFMKKMAKPATPVHVEVRP
jgi:hypothetical protein